MTEHFTVDRPRRRGKRDQFALEFPKAYIQGESSKAPPGVKEIDIQRDVLQMLRLHPKVGWCHRLNTAAGFLVDYKAKGVIQTIIDLLMRGHSVHPGVIPKGFRLKSLLGRFIRFAFPGCSDIVGQLKPREGERAGAFMAIEVKGESGQPTDEQRDFLSMVEGYGGCAGIARSAEQAKKLVDQFYSEGPW